LPAWLKTAALDVWRLRLVLPQHPVCSSTYHQAGMFLQLLSRVSLVLESQRDLLSELLASSKRTTR